MGCLQCSNFSILYLGKLGGGTGCSQKEEHGGNVVRLRGLEILLRQLTLPRVKKRPLEAFLLHPGIEDKG